MLVRIGSVGENSEMMMFWATAAVLLVGAMSLLLPALIYPRDGSGDRCPPSRLAAAVVGASMCVGSIGIYLALGRPTALEESSRAPPAAATVAGQHAMTPAQIEELAARLAERLKGTPDDVEGWVMLGRSYTVLGRYADAATALRRANELAPAQAGLLADYADALAMAQGRRLAGEPARLIQAALDADPRNVKALALAGSVAFEARDYGSAQAYWQRLLALVPPDSDMARSAQSSINEARQLGGGPAIAAAPRAADAAASQAVSGQVEIDPRLRQRVRAGDTLYVFARAVDGPRMPLAILRQPVARWPASFTLDDSSAMAPSLRLSGFARIVIGARISRSGSATPQSGDLTGRSQPLAPGARAVHIVVDQVEP